MVSNISYLTGRVGQRVTGFGTRRRTTRSGCGVKTALVHSIANALLGTGRRRVYRKRRTVSAGSYKLSGAGRRPKSRLGLRRRVYHHTTLGTGYRHRTVHRKPRATLGLGRRRTYRRRVMY